MHGKMTEMKYEHDTVKNILPMLDFLTVVDKEDIRKGVDYTRNAVRRDETLKKDDENVRQIS